MEKYLKKNIPSALNVLNGNLVSFWLDNVIRVYSLEDIEYYELMVVEE